MGGSTVLLQLAAQRVSKATTWPDIAALNSAAIGKSGSSAVIQMRPQFAVTALFCILFEMRSETPQLLTDDITHTHNYRGRVQSGSKFLWSSQKSGTYRSHKAEGSLRSRRAPSGDRLPFTTILSMLTDCR